MNLITDISSGLVVITGVVVADAQTDAVTQYAGLIEKFGVMAVLLLYFLVRDYFRNKADEVEKVALKNKQDALEEFIREKLTDKLDDAVTTMRESKRVNKQLLTALEHKAPCMAQAAIAAQASMKETSIQ